MAILRFELEIDSEVYPELYARLAGLSRTSAREEKLRQLAATGLLWEMARLHGPALTDLGAAEAPPSAAPAPVGQLDDDGVAPAPMAMAPMPAHPDEDERRPSPGPPFVDLALDVAPAPSAAAEVPVLLDEVPPSLLHEVPAVTVAMVVPIRSEAPPPPDEPEAAEPVTVRRPAARERLKRMRDRGLFQNG